MADLERAIGVQSGFSVSAPHKLRDKDTGRLREFDILVTMKAAHHEVITAIECRDKARKVGVPEVEAFKIKCDKCGVDRGIIVSSGGFRDSAIEKANALGIGCMTLGQVIELEWLKATGLTQRTRNVHGVPHFDIDVGGVPHTGEMIIVTADGRIWDGAAQTAAANAWLDQIPFGEDEVEGAIYSPAVVVEDPPLYIQMCGGARLRIRKIVARFRYSISILEIPFRLVSYRDEVTGIVHTDAVCADVSVRGQPGKVMAVRGADGFVRVTWIPTVGKPSSMGPPAAVR